MTIVHWSKLHRGQVVRLIYPTGNSKIKAGALAVTCCVASDGSGRIVTANGNYTVIRGCVQLPAKPNTGKTFRVPFYLLT
jgi:hypothetical protein